MSGPIWDGKEWVVFAAALAVPFTASELHIHGSTGSDVNDGATPSTAIASWGEALRRIAGGVIKPVGGLLTVTLHASPNDSFTPLLKVGETSAVLFQGAGSTTVASGPIDTLVVEDPTSRTPWKITSNLLDWTTLVDKRLRMTSGAAVGAVAIVRKDLTAHTARVSEFVIPDPLNQTGTVVAPAQHDTFVVEDLVTLDPDDWDITGGVVAFDSINLSGDVVSTKGAGIQVFSGCTVSANDALSLAAASTVSVGTGYSGAADLQTAGQVSFIGGATSVFHKNLNGGAVTYDGQFAFQGCHFEMGAGTTVFLQQVQIFDSPVEHGMHVHTEASFKVAPSPFGDTAVWGEDNAVTGISVQAHAALQVGAGLEGALNLVGGVANASAFMLGGETTAQAWNPALNGGKGDYDTPVDCTYANLVAAASAGGLRNLKRDAAIVTGAS